MTQQPDDAPLVAEQIAYYRARAAEYDQWFLREGRYDRGPEHRAEWFREAALVESALRTANLRGLILELACGTGLWTRHLVVDDSRVIAVDSSLEVLTANRSRVKSDRISFVAADIFSLPLAGWFDAVFFSFWLSHVPETRFERFWASVAARLKPDGRVFFIDSLRDPTSTAVDHPPPDQSGIAHRRLSDGREFDVVKVFHEPVVLERRLRLLGWSGSVASSGRFFLHGLFGRPRLG
ncbi:MAG TPA: class I SAM-dependent methyltransferase [Vicinamibacterales bacterium]|nr:class I SAM-dependent methyltransferase [Vicinamibacterales bacterium]